MSARDCLGERRLLAKRLTAGCLDVGLDRAVLIECVRERVVVVANSC